jgi:hypothetical protein
MLTPREKSIARWFLVIGFIMGAAEGFGIVLLVISIQRIVHG